MAKEKKEAQEQPQEPTREQQLAAKREAINALHDEYQTRRKAIEEQRRALQEWYHAERKKL